MTENAPVKRGHLVRSVNDHLQAGSTPSVEYPKGADHDKPFGFFCSHDYLESWQNKQREQLAELFTASPVFLSQVFTDDICQAIGEDLNYLDERNIDTSTARILFGLLTHQLLVNAPLFPSSPQTVDNKWYE